MNEHFLDDKLSGRTYYHQPSTITNSRKAKHLLEKTIFEKYLMEEYKNDRK